MAINSPLSTLNKTVNITSGTGAINLGADAAAKTVTVGNATGATSLVLRAGTGNLIGSSTGTLLLDSAGVLELNSSAGAISIGNDAVDNAVNIGSGGARAVTVGSLSGASSLALRASGGNMTVSTASGSGGFITISSDDELSLSAQFGVRVNSSTGDIQLGNNADSGNIQIGLGAAARAITIGNTTGATSVTLNSGTGGVAINSTGTGDIVLTSADRISLSSAQDVDVQSTSANVNIAANNVSQNVNIGTGIGSKVIRIGAGLSATSISLEPGSGGLAVTSFNTTGAVVSNASGVLTDASASTAGYVLTSNGAGSPPSFQAAGGGGGMSWTIVTGITQAMTSGEGYIANNSLPVVFTLPSTSAVGDLISVQGYGSGGWRISQGASQLIRVGNVVTTTGALGYVLSANQYDAATFVCVVANTEWLCMNALSSGLDLL